MSLDAGQVEDFLEQPRKVIDLRDGERGLLAADIGGQRGVSGVGDGHADGGERCPEVVTERAEQGRREVGALTGELRRTPFLQEARASRCDGDDARDRIGGPGLDRTPAQRPASPTGRMPTRTGTSVTAARGRSRIRWWPP